MNEVNHHCHKTYWKRLSNFEHKPDGNQHFKPRTTTLPQTKKFLREIVQRT